MKTATDLMVPNPNQLEPLKFTILAACAGYFAMGQSLQLANSELRKSGCSRHAILVNGISYFLVPEGTEWNGPLHVKYPDNAQFRLTKLGSI